MIVIGENLNIMSPKLGEAFIRRDPGPVRDVASQLNGAGIDFMDINIGPARKDGRDLMEWVVKTVQEVSDLPLCLDTTNIEAMEAGLEASGGKALMNSISARPERMNALLPLARKYDAAFIGLTIGEDGLPHDANERGLLAAQIIAGAGAYGIEEKDIWIDPVALPVNSQQLHIRGCAEFVRMLPDLAPSGKSTCGLSNISSGAPQRLRGVLNRTYLIMLKRWGMYSVIADAFDKELLAIAKGEMAEAEALVGKVMAREEIDMSTLSGKELEYVKTAKVLLGDSVYWDSWLEI
jgi:5-methyltetrahydrofolate corrinoid/iron sulfur protein methyltransferase